MNTFEYCIPNYNGADNWCDIKGYSAEDAARRVAREYNVEGDYPLNDEGTEYVLIRKDKDSPIQIFSISAEPSIEYYATEQTEFKCKNCGGDLRERIMQGEAYSHDNEDFCEYACSEQYRKKWWAEYRAKHGLDK